MPTMGRLFGPCALVAQSGLPRVAVSLGCDCTAPDLFGPVLASPRRPPCRRYSLQGHLVEMGIRTVLKPFNVDHLTAAITEALATAAPDGKPTGQG